MTNRRGSTMTVVIGVIAAAVVAGVIWYFVSDPFRTKVNTSFKDATQWTPERIAKDPVAYLDFCEEKANKALQDLKAAEISIAQSEGVMTQGQKQASEKVDGGMQILRGLKGAYQKAAEADTWPVAWNDSRLSKDQAELQLVTLYKGVQSQQDRLASTTAQLKKLESQKLRILTARAEAQQQLDKIKTGRETLKVQKITDDLANQLASVQGVLNTTIDAATDTAGTIKTLDQLTNEAAPKTAAADVKMVLDQIK